MEEAIGYFYEALAILEALPDSDANRRRRLALVFDQTPEFHWTNRHRELHELLLRHELLVASLDDPSQTGTFYGRLSHRQLVFGQYETALGTATRGLEACDVAGNAEAGGLCCMVQVWVRTMLGDLSGATSAHKEARERLAIDFNPAWFMYTQAGVALAHLAAGRWDDAMRELDEAAETGMERADAGTTSFARAVAALVLVERGDGGRAVEFSESAVQLAPTVYFRGYAFAFHAAALCDNGQIEQGLPLLEQIATMTRAAGHEMGWMWIARRLALAYVEAGRPADARHTLIALREAAARDNAPFFAGASDRLLAELALANGDAAGAIRLLSSAVATLRAHDCKNELALALAFLGRAQRLAGDPSLAEPNLTEALAILKGLGTLRVPEWLQDATSTTAAREARLMQ